MSIELISATVALAAVVLLALFVLTMRFRAMGDPEALLQKIHRRQQKLLPYVANDENTAENDQRLYRAMGRLWGVLQMPRDACAVLSLCASLSRSTDPEEHLENTRRAEIIILGTPAACLEALTGLVAPWMPRPYLRLIAVEYWRLCISLQTLVATHRPNLIERVAEVL